MYFVGPSPHQDLTYSSKRKMSQRQKRNRVHVGTQTEEIYFSDLGRQMNGNGEFYEGDELLYERLVKAEEVRTTTTNINIALLLQMYTTWICTAKVNKAVLSVFTHAFHVIVLPKLLSYSNL